MSIIEKELTKLALQNRKESPINSDEWDFEPDILEFKTSDDYHLVIWRNPNTRNLNGYVGINREHPYFALHYDKKQIRVLDIHGGSTYSGKKELEFSKRKYWYIGFDTSHSGDISPSTHDLMKNYNIHRPEFHKEFETYKNIDYVIKEVVRLYEQMKGKEDKTYVHNFKTEYKRLSQIKKREQMWSNYFVKNYYKTLK